MPLRSVLAWLDVTIRAITNIPSEARNAAEKLYDRIGKRLPLFQPTEK
jgi:hypothetical protein